MTEPEAEGAAPSASAAPVSAPPNVPVSVAVEAARAKDDARAELEKRLVRDVVAGERFRTLLLASIATVMLLLLELEGRASQQRGSVLRFTGGFDRLTVEAFLLVVAVFELYVLAWSKNLLVAGGRPQTMRRYLHAFVETSLPTAVILYYAAVDGPVQALLMPPSFVYFVFILLSTLGLEPLLCLFTGAVAASEYALVALLWGAGDGLVSPPSLASQPHHLGKALVLLVGGVAAAFVAMRLRRSLTQAIESFGERTRILGVFGQHVSPEVVERLVAHGSAEVKSEQRSVCVMFLDIRNFTAFAEQKGATEVVDYLNTVFEATIEAVVRHNGIVNKFLGDGFMAVFGAPMDDDNPSRSAVLAAMDIVSRVAELVATGALPPTTVGLGLHTGSAVVGNIGSASRKEYTVVGDVVNLASRIESMNKELGTRVLVSDATWVAAAVAPAVPGAKLHEAVTVRGRKRPIRLWELA